MKHTQKMLDIDHIDLNRHIEKTILSDSATPSATLKFYNELLQNTNFALPNRKLLEIDQKIFKEAVVRLRKAQKVEIQWMRKAAEHESKKYMKMRFAKTQKAIQDECV